MDWLVTAFLDLVSVWVRRSGGSAVGESRLDREAKKLGIGCLAVVGIVILIVVGFAEGWW